MGQTQKSKKFLNRKRSSRREFIGVGGFGSLVIVSLRLRLFLNLSVWLVASIAPLHGLAAARQWHPKDQPQPPTPLFALTVAPMVAASPVSHRRTTTTTRSWSRALVLEMDLLPANTGLRQLAEIRKAPLESPPTARLTSNCFAKPQACRFPSALYLSI